ncbi:MAG: hypothetical protein PHW60_01130 [Kiritimatiellae bacterium]|nr:hypothetical protein [Kiritimatiellia bacterium]
MSWLLTYNGTTKSFAEWGLSNLRRSRVSQAEDTVSFTAPGLYDAAELFPYGSTITLSYKNDSSGAVAPWFYGRVVQVPRSGSGTEESMDYELAGPWWFLDNLVYQQIWSAGMRPQPYTLAEDEVKLGEETIGETPDEVVYDLIGVYKSRVILGQDPAGDPRSSGEVITDVINYAIASGAPIQLDPEDPIEPDLEIPFDEQQDITCAEAIRRMLRWSPDAVTWFDYSTTPYPTFHCARRSALESLSLALQPSSGSQISNNQISNLQVIPRSDLIVPAVVLKFEQTNTIDGTEYESIVIDKFPLAATGREFAALTATLQLAGFQANYVTQKVVSTLIPLIEDSFWTAHDPTYLTTGTQVSAVIGSSIKSATPYDYELKEGQIQDWMTGKHAREVTYTAQVRTTTFDTDLTTKLKEEIRSVSCTIITTDAVSNTYTQLASLVTGESIPVGLAKALYDSLHPLQYEGSVTLTEEECCSTVATALRAASGFVLNLTGGLTSWETMNALIQKVDEDVDSGRTTISFGPAEQLSPQDLVERLRANRGRGVAFSFIKRTTGESSSGSATVALSGPTPLLNTAGASGQTKLLVVTNNTQKITLDPAQIAALTSAVNELKIRKVSVCDSETGTVRYMLTIASEVFDE